MIRDSEHTLSASALKLRFRVKLLVPRPTSYFRFCHLPTERVALKLGPLWSSQTGLAVDEGHFSPPSESGAAAAKLTQQLRVGAEQELVEDVIVALAGREPGHARLQEEKVVKP